MSEWITDRKPTKFGVYLVTLPDENSSGNSRFVDIETFDPEDGWDSLYKVLAWQELPKPYDGEIKAIPVEQLLSILPKYDDYIHMKTYPYNEAMEDIYSEGHEEGWNACLRAIKEELDYWEKENEGNRR